MLECWRCQRKHEFLRKSSTALRPTAYAKSYTNTYYEWLATKEFCPSGGAMREGFDPCEQLVVSERKRKLK